ncbi:MAG: 50S ribosomal protein L13 [Thermoprotei archaeon]|nr:50S ribosomal protein L13 [Thermoprotei archaeon]
MSSDREVFVDGAGMVLGRLASIVAKKLLGGYRVYVVNVDKIVVSGDRTRMIQYYKRTILNVKSHYSHRWRPKRPRSPVRLFKATVWGMLPKNNKGVKALKRLKAYIGVPEELSSRSFVKFPEADSSKLSRPGVTLNLIARELGWRGRS